MAETWDVFISYARADQGWVRTLATNLHNLGLDVFLDEWESAQVMSWCIAWLEQRLWELDQVRHRTSPDDPILLRGYGGVGLDTLLEQIGDHLGRAFLAGPVAEVLSAAAAEATRLNCPLVLGVDIRDEALAALPWETLRLPDQPGPALTLHPRVELYRLLSTPGSVPALAIPGPLRLLVAIGSPEAQEVAGLPSPTSPSAWRQPWSIGVLRTPGCRV